MKKKNLLGFIIIFAIIILTFLSGIVDFIVNIKWFKEVGYLSVYFTKIKAILIMIIPIFIISFVSIWLYYRSLKNNIKKNNLINIDESKRKIGKRIFYLLDVIISFFISYTFASTYWYRILQFTNSVDFNIKDPTFSKDVSFYVFKLPLIESTYRVIMLLLGFLVIITFVFYFLVNLKDKIEYGKDFKENIREIKFTDNNIKKFAGKQLAVLSFLIMIFIAVGYLIKSWNLVYSPNGVVFGASYTDIHVSLIFYRIISIAAAVSSVVIFLSVLKEKFKPIIISVIVIVALIIVNGVSAGVVQNFVVKSNEKTLEQPYIKNNIDLTRKAFDIDKTESVPFEVKNDLTKKDIKDNKESIDNIIINSFKPTLEFYNQVQIIRYYYNFNDADIDRYNIKGKYNQVFVAAREIDSEALNPNTWQNRHLIYTHGYGAVMNKVNSVTSEGQPDFVIKDIPPNNKTKIPFTDPRIYFGEKTNDYAVVNTKISEFDYPKGDSNKTNKYAGDAGINMTFGNKLLFAINKKEINFILSKDIKSDSKILINRNIVERAKKIAPFLKYDGDPYMVINKGKIYWILDGYTNTDRYPYSEPYDNINYIRNSVKVVIDSTNGKTDFYMMNNNDPIINSYNKIFDGLFKNINEMPKELRDHIKYPKDLFNIQSKVLGKYHVKDPGVFYNGEDLWEVSRNKKKVEGEKDENDAPYMITKLPGQEKEEMILLNYFNVMKKDNMIALFATRMDGKNYGKKIVYKLPADKTIYSPYLFKQKINQDTTISKELSLWNKEGSQVQYGDTVILPIKNSLLYIEPLYLRASGKNSIPEMKRIIMSYGDKLILANSIEEGIQNIFDYKEKKDTVISKGDKKEPSPKTADVTKAKDFYNKAVEAQKKGDWTEYGKNINELGKLLNDLK